MSEEHFVTINATTLKSLLDFKASRTGASGAEFSEEDAAVDVMLSTERGEKHPFSRWAERWGWSKSRVFRSWPTLVSRSEAQRESVRIYKAKQAETLVERRETQMGENGVFKTDPETQVERLETQVERPDHNHPPAPVPASGGAPAKESINNNIYTLFSKDSASKQDRLQDATPDARSQRRGTVAQSPPSFDAVLAYFLDRGGASQIKGLDWSDEAAQWMDHYTSNGWRVGKNPMVDWKGAVRNWIRNIKKGIYGTASKTGGPDRQRTGRLQDPGGQKPGTGRALQAGVSSRQAGGFGPTGGDSARRKRDGELNPREYLQRCGFSEDEIWGFLSETEDSETGLATLAKGHGWRGGENDL